MGRRRMLIGNWKMHKTVAQARQFAEGLAAQSQALSDDIDFAVCPPFTALQVLRVVLPSRVKTGAQNMHYADDGAFTGEIAPAMVKETGATYVVLGHSERRHVFGETDALIAKKVAAAVVNELTPILCVGEDQGQREAGDTLAVVEAQTVSGLAELTLQQVNGVVIAYEPVWAIGSGITPSPEDAEGVIAHIRQVISAHYGNATAEGVRILYGGSVKPANIADFMKQPNIDGALVGGASLEPDSFVQMAVAMEEGNGND
jgi:triosephosphate isomerase